MALFVLSDPHLSFDTDKPMDVFGGGWKNHAEKLRAAFFRCVSPEDTVVLPGDISWAMTLQEARRDLQFLDGLPGRKLISKGNHDYWWQTAHKIETFFAEEGITTIRLLHNNAYRAEGFLIAGTRGWMPEVGETRAQNEKLLRRETQRLALSLTEAEKLRASPQDELIAFLHYPPLLQTFRCEPILALLRERGVSACVYGHLHGTFAPLLEGEQEGVRFFCASADYLQFCPKEIRKPLSFSG